MLACSHENPAYDRPTETGDGSTLGTTEETAGATVDAGTTTTTTAGGSDSDSATGTSGATTGATTGETTGTTAPADPCGDMIVDADEDCDDGNEIDDDGCVACVIPSTCAELLDLAPGSPSGVYLVDPAGSGEPWAVTCDMELDGGGWTGFTVQDTCNGHLSSQITGVKPAESEGVDGECRPYAEYANGGDYHYNWDISFPPGLHAFFVRGYEVQGLGDVELKYVQTMWSKASDFPNGALSLGSADADGPIANWAQDGGMLESFTDGQILPYPVQDVPFVLDQSTQTLRISWGEIGINNEGLYPWWAGQIFVR
ncbi:MAG: hypothetical protein KC486_26860 [Myxococcales bacterium]|nr:hypothetical protein [Myxococcales bacterium]